MNCPPYIPNLVVVFGVMCCVLWVLVFCLVVSLKIVGYRLKSSSVGLDFIGLPYSVHRKFNSRRTNLEVLGFWK